MALTNKQKSLLHMIPQRMGLDEAQRRIIQQNAGGFLSAADKTASHEGFVAVMAFYEHRSGGQLEPYTPGYWAAQHDKNEAQGPNSRVLWRIRNAATKLGWTDGQVNAFLAGKHMSGGRYDDVQTAPAYWLRRLCQGLIEMGKRITAENAEAAEA